jgi:uncharacterized protein YjeT (DUF2065 family)
MPDTMKRLAARAMATPAQSLRVSGLIAACVGVVLVWVLRHS